MRSPEDQIWWDAIEALGLGFASTTPDELWRQCEELDSLAGEQESLDPTRDAPPGHLDELVNRLQACSDEERNGLFEAVYDELRGLARKVLRGERPDRGLQSADLVNEACIRLLRDEGHEFTSLSHFFAYVSSVMRDVLIDTTRVRMSARRRTARERVLIEDLVEELKLTDLDLAVLHDSLERLQAAHRLQWEIVQLRFFGGLAYEEIGALFGKPTHVIETQWALAKRWLEREI